MSKHTYEGKSRIWMLIVLGIMLITAAVLWWYVYESDQAEYSASEVIETFPNKSQQYLQPPIHGQTGL